MRNHFTISTLLICGAFTLPALTANLHADAGNYLSPVALVVDDEGKTLFIAEETAKQIAVFDPAKAEVLRRIALPDEPSGLVLSADGERLYVTGASPEGAVHVIDTASGEIVDSIAVGHTPGAPVLSPDGDTLYVCNRFDGDVSVIDLAANKEVARVPVSREPVGAALSLDGRYLFVVNQLPEGPANADYVAAKVSVIDTQTRKTVSSIPFPNGSNGLREISVSPDGKYAYVTHILARFQLITTQLERGWMNTNALSVIDIASRTLLTTVLLDDVDLGAANPWGVVCSPDGKYICVSHAGTHEVSVIDRALLHEKLDRVADGQKVSDVSRSLEDVPNDLSFLTGIRRRLALDGNGPRGLAVAGSKVYVAEYFSGTVGVVDFDFQKNHRPRSMSLGGKTALSEARQGEIFFHDASQCFQKWQSCMSCHPSEGRPDGLNWDLLNDGIGNPKNTKNLMLAHRTPPAMITGIRADAETAVRAGLKFIQFAVRPDEDASAIDEYLKTLAPVPSPHLVHGELSPAARRGEAVFKTAGCNKCHRTELFTNQKKSNVGTGINREEGIEFDTPTLVEVWRSAPYLHDGRAETIAEVLTTHNPGDRHGETSGLSQKEIADLAEYVLSQ